MLTVRPVTTSHTIRLRLSITACKDFMPSPDEGSCSAQNALITGRTRASFVTARTLALAGARVFIACRDTALAAGAAARLQEQTGRTIDVLPLDLGDLDSVRQCAERFSALGVPLHLLMNNAGVGGTRGLTRSGFEIAFGVNHLGHFLLTKLSAAAAPADGRAS